MTRGSRRPAWRTVLQTAIVLVVVGAITFIGSQVSHVNATTVGFAYLVAILFVAAKWGLFEATAGSVAAVLCFNYFFLPPVGTFTVADPQNWVALFAFLATAITASHLSAQAHKRAEEAQNRQREMERLYALSRSILLIEPTESVPKQLANQIASSLDASAVTVYDRKTGDLYHSGPEDFPGLDDQLRQSAVHGTLFRNPSTGTVITAIRLGADPIGSLGISGVELTDSALQSLANLVAIGLERARAQEAANRAEAARQSDELKSTLLDAVAHEFKTPLTTIKAATTALLASDQPKPERQRGFISIVDEEADRLSGLVSEAIQVARIESGRVHLQRRRCAVRDIVARVLQKMKPALAERSVELRISPDLPLLSVDPELIELTVRQLLDNAVKYSSPGSPLLISAEVSSERVIVHIADRGPGIPEADQPHIFDKFYRARNSHHQTPGAGLGLAIAREIVLAHDGDIWVESKPGDGAAFHISLPVAGLPATGMENNE